MRPIEEILRTYNIVNSRSGSRYTVRFTAGFLLAGAFVVAAAMLLTGGPHGATTPETLASQEDEQNGAAPVDDADPFTIGVIESPDEVYIGYPVDAYDPSQKARYDRDLVNVSVLEWLSGHPETPILGGPKQVYDPAGDGILLGYILEKAETPTLP